jgi:uncharacterized protein YceK
MARAVIRLAVAVSVLWLGGCGTMNTWRDEDVDFQSINKYPRRGVYGGVQLDAAELSEAAGAAFTGTVLLDTGERVTLDWDERAVAPALALLHLLDLPLSAAADTLLLPWTISASLNRKPDPEPPAGPRRTLPVDPLRAEWEKHKGPLTYDRISGNLQPPP